MCQAFGSHFKLTFSFSVTETKPWFPPKSRDGSKSDTKLDILRQKPTPWKNHFLLAGLNVSKKTKKLCLFRNTKKTCFWFLIVFLVDALTLDLSPPKKVGGASLAALVESFPGLVLWIRSGSSASSLGRKKPWRNGCSALGTTNCRRRRPGDGPSEDRWGSRSQNSNGGNGLYDRFWDLLVCEITCVSSHTLSDYIW